MIEIAYSHIPTKYIQQVRRRSDMDFALAHLVLKDVGYLRAYRFRPRGRKLLLDNGLFENGEPLPIADLVEAAKLVDATYVIAPDRTDDWKWTCDKVVEFIEACDQNFGVAAVITGPEPAQMAKCYKFYASIGVDMYCWTFLLDRYSAIRQITDDGVGIDKEKPHHLLGFSTREELRMTVGELPFRLQLSLDSSKPINAAFSGERIADSGRGKYKRPSLDSEIDEVLLDANISTFAEWVSEIG